MQDTIRIINNAVLKTNIKELSKSLLILKHSHNSASALLKAFEDVRKARGTSAGVTTDNEQDLLRAMLVLSAAGLDSMSKQIIKDTLPKLSDIDIKVEQGIETFLARQIRKDSESTNSSSSNRFLARLLVAQSHRKQAIQEYINDLTAGSLQSPEELTRIAFALGVDPNLCSIDADILRPIFKTRNKIIHELDIDFATSKRNRHNRSKKQMVAGTNTLLEISEKIFVEVFKKLRT